MSRIATVLLFVLISGPIVTAQTVLHVDDDAPPGGDGLSWVMAFDTLTPALEAAQPGDQIWVAAGTYVGNFTLAPDVEMYGGFDGTETELTQRNWVVNETILDGNASGSVVRFQASTSKTTRIDGFTITNGSGMTISYSTRGGGIYLANSSLAISNNTITGNSAQYGGGLYVRYSSPTIENNTITGNSASARGGLWSAGSVGGHGGGLYVQYSSPTITNNTITGNSASAGGGLYLSGSDGTIANNTIATNGAGYDGGGLYLSNSSPTITNTIVAFNSSGIWSDSTPTLRYNCVYGNTAYDYSGLGDPGGTDGNISADPQLAGPSYGNLHIQPGSPCVDAGSNADAWGDFDADGGARILPLDGTVDIGADESDGTVWPEGPYAIVRVSSEGEDTHNGSSWALAKRTVQAGIDTASALGGEVWVKVGTYGQCVTLHPYAFVYGGFLGVETLRGERDWVANVTTLDGQQQGSVVTAQPGYRVSAIDGFTITNGNAYTGGGLYLGGSSLTIENNSITGNHAEYGGGLWLSSSSPTIANNTITGNTSFDDGGGLYLGDSSPTIENNSIIGNSANENGGGLWLFESSPTIANNTIAGNSAVSGGGLYLWASSATIENNTIMGNNGFGGLYLWYSSPTIENNIIEGNDGRGLWLEHSSPTIENNMITDNNGGGLGLDNSDGTIAYNTITGNSASDEGGGLWLFESSPTIANNTIANNTIPGYGNSYGAGLYLALSSPTITNNTITGNASFGTGGGLYLTSSSPTILGNTIMGNGAEWGGGLYLGASSATIANNRITANGAIYGGGLFLDNSTPTIANNTITENGALHGGGLYLEDSCPAIANTIIAFNSSGVLLDSGSPTLRHNCVYGNTDYDYSGLADPTGTDGNVLVDPLFADPKYGNLHIQPESPCVDTGSNADAWSDFDVDGDARILPLGGTVDIGADESDGTVWPEGPYAIVRVSSAGEDTNNGSSWALAKRTVQAGIIAASALGGEVWVQAGAYEERITLQPYAYIYGGFAGDETVRDERDWVANVSVLDGQQQGSVVTAQPGYRVSAIDGFTITNGDAYSGGGLFLSFSSPTIANNTIAGNSAEYGGGLYLWASFASITNNTITGNSATGHTGDGGGLFMFLSSPTIANNTIANNGAVDNGGGLHLMWDSFPTIVNNTISGNSAYQGGGLYLNGSSPTITNNTITGNSAVEGGGGLCLVYSSSPAITNNSITGNSATGGGGLCMYLSPFATITNNTITGNSAVEGGGLFITLSLPTIANTIVAFNSSGIVQSDTDSTTTLRYNCVYGNTAYDYSGLADPAGTDGNLSADPMFARQPDPGLDGEWATDDDDYGDLHLSLDSPLIDAGDNAAVPADVDDHDGDGDTTEPIPFDHDGYDRFVDDPRMTDTGNPGPPGPVVDMGAYERRPGDCMQNDETDHDGDVDFADYAGLVGCLAGPDGDPPDGCGCFDLNGSGRVDLTDVAVFQRLFTGE